MFKVGDKVVYGVQGVCQVADISTLKMDGIPKDRVYYTLRIIGKGEGNIYVPKDNVRMIMRHILTPKEANDLIEDIPNIDPLPDVNDKEREMIYRDCIKSCDCRQLIRIIKSLYLRGRQRVESGKKVSSLDDRYLKQAEENLYSELSIPLEIPREEMGDYMADRMENLLQGAQ